MEIFDIHSKKIQLAASLKLQQLKREGLPNLNEENITDVLMKGKWKKNKPASLHEAIDDIMSLSNEDVVIMLSMVAITDSKNKKISDFNDLMGG